jgi:two-component system, cell cycle response regulator DivK
MSGKHALVVDDNLQNLRVLSQLLTRNQVNCTEVADPLALQNVLLQLEQVDVVFLDLEMPGIDGFSAKEMLRQYLGDLPIIACTVHVSEIDVVRQHGFDGFLGKPLNSARFPQQLARILNGESVWDRG